ncbi:MAG: alpha/beta fold hydrolase [Nitratireductor sp.]|nr:alpha/beta fold hydrolase [Nitratireductor sp.]
MGTPRPGYFDLEAGYKWLGMRQDDERPGIFGQTDKLEIIDHIYQVAVEPERYEQLLDLWEERLGPLRAGDSPRADGSAGSIHDSELENHFARASAVLDRVDQFAEGRDVRAIVNAFDRSAAFTFCDTGDITAANGAAKLVLGISPGASVAALPFEEAEISVLRREAARVAASGGASDSFVRFRLTTTRRPIVIRLTSVSDRERGRFEALAVTSEMAWPEPLSAVVREAFGLTETEAEILRALVEGAGLKEIASRRGRSLGTIKTQLRSLLFKSETRTQAELIRLTLGLMDVVSTADAVSDLGPAAHPSGGLKPLPFLALERPGGRRSDHILFGDPAGRPVLFFPLNYGLIRWPVSAELAAERLGLKIIVPIRAGYGHSTKAESRSAYVDTVVEDTVALLDHYGIEQCPVIALSADAYFAYRIANRYPGRLTGLVNCGTGLPLANRAQYERMHKWHRFILANARYAPSMLPFMVKAGFSLARRIGKRGFVHAVYGNSQADVLTFEDPEVMEAMVLGSEVCLSSWHSAHEAFSHEVIAEQYDWSDLVHNCGFPVIIWQGHQDPQVPMATVRELQQLYPQISWHEDEKAGQLIFFKNWPRILECVEPLLA